MLAVYIYFFFNLQIVHGATYQTKATELARRGIPIVAQRGEIFDRNYDEPLVINVPSFAVSVIPAEIDKDSIDELFQRVARFMIAK